MRYQKIKISHNQRPITRAHSNLKNFTPVYLKKFSNGKLIFCFIFPLFFLVTIMMIYCRPSLISMMRAVYFISDSKSEINQSINLLYLSSFDLF